MTDLAVRHPKSAEMTAGLARTREAPLAALLCAVCGTALLWVVGFADIEAVHNAAHDTRHSALFPCH